jgi:UDP-N-acetylmuramoylalanine--D-glutamate ligase
MKIAIIGFGLEGRAAYDYYQSGNEITICDQNEAVETPEGVKTQLGEGYLNNLNAFDVVVRSPYVQPSKLVAANDFDILEKVTSSTNEFFKVCPTKNIIGVTGTKGKGTTSTLITKILEAAGKTVHLGGNIGVPALELLKQNIQLSDYVVLELSSFQLIDLRSSPHIAVCLLIAPEHLDWHEDFEEYVAAKQQLFMNQDDDDIAIYFAENDDSISIADASMGVQIPYFASPGAAVRGLNIFIGEQKICEISELKLLGKHNWQNVCAAITAAWQVTQDVPAIHDAVTKFTGLPFRLELRAEKNGVRYYNDSFASAPPAPLAALESISGMKVLILGGFDRGLDLSELADGIKNAEQELRSVVVMGASGPRVVEALQKAGFKNFKLTTAATMEAVVAEATAAARSGDAVLLSPGFASFDMFKNFVDRGEQFNASVEAL